MAKFKGKELYLADGQRAIFGTDLDSHIWWDDAAQELRLDTTISGVDPVQDYQLTTKFYVDDLVGDGDWQNSVISGTTGNPPGSPSDGDRYLVASGTGDWAGCVGCIAEWSDTNNEWTFYGPEEGSTVYNEGDDTTYIYRDGEWVNFATTLCHSDLQCLDSDDHLIYVPRDGTRGFTATVSGVTPTEDYHLTTKQYVDSQYSGLDWQDSVITMSGTAPGSPSTGDRYLITTGAGDWAGHDDEIVEWDGDSWEYTVPNEGFATWVEDEDVIYVFDGTNWIRLGTIVDHGNLTGLEDDDHLQYVPTDAARGFTATVSGIDPTLDYHLTTKWYVDQGNIDRKGKQAIPNGVAQVSVGFADIGDTDYIVNATMANTTDSPPSIYAYIVSATTTSGFTVSFIGDMDSANYVLHWSVLREL